MSGPRDSKPPSKGNYYRYPANLPYVRDGPSKVERSTYDSVDAVPDTTRKRKLKPYAYSSIGQRYRADDWEFIRRPFSDRNHATTKTHVNPLTGQYSHEYPNNETDTRARWKGETPKITTEVKKLNQFSSPTPPLGIELPTSPSVETCKKRALNNCGIDSALADFSRLHPLSAIDTGWTP